MQWNRYILPPTGERETSLRRSPECKWLLGPAAVKLPAGRYSVYAGFNPGLGVERQWGEGIEQLRASAIFEVKAAINETEQAVHEGRLAEWSYRAGQYAEAVTHAKGAMEGGGTYEELQIIRLFVLTADALLAQEKLEEALKTYEDLLRFLAADSELRSEAEMRLKWLKSVIETSSPESTPEATPEATPESTPGATPESTPESTPDATQESGPEATLESTPGIQP